MTIKGTDRSLNKARELIEEALSTPSREIESDQSPQMPSLSTTATDSSGHSSCSTAAHSAWGHKRQPETMLPAATVSSHPPTCGAGLGPSSFATAVIGNTGARRPANPVLVPTAMAGPPELCSHVSSCVTSQQLVSSLVGERGGETRGNACAASSPSPSRATPTSTTSVSTSSEPTLARSVDNEKSLTPAAQDGGEEEEEEEEEASETEENTEALQSPQVHTRSGSEPLIRPMSSVRPNSSIPSCSLPSLSGQPSASFSLIPLSSQVSTASPSHDPIARSSSISVISSVSLSQLAQEDKVTSPSSVVTGVSRSTKTVGIVTPTQAVKPVQVGGGPASAFVCISLYFLPSVTACPSGRGGWVGFDIGDDIGRVLSSVLFEFGGLGIVSSEKVIVPSLLCQCIANPLD